MTNDIPETVLKKVYFFNMTQQKFAQIYKRIPILKCDFDKVAKQLYWNRTSAWVLSYKFAAYFQNTFYQEHLWAAAFAHSKIWETMKTTERRYWRCSSIFILNLKQFSPLAFVLQLLTLNRYIFSGKIHIKKRTS